MSAGVVYAALFAQLTHASVAAVAPGGIHRDRAPAGTSYPFVVLGAEPVEVSDVLAGEAYFGGEWTVRVVDTGDSAKAADDAYAVVHGRLQAAELTIAGYTSMVCRRRTFFSYDEDIEGGGRAQHVGGTYLIMAT
jgi:hypothetical protein